MQELLYRYTMSELRALARSRGLSVKGQLKDEYVQRLARLLLEPENIDPVLEGLGEGELLLLMLIDVLRDGPESTAAGVQNAHDALWGQRHTDGAGRDLTGRETMLNRLESLGLMIGPTYPGGPYEVPPAVTARAPVPQAVFDLLPDHSASAITVAEPGTPSVTLLDLILMLAHEVRRGEVRPQLPPTQRTGHGQPPRGWEFGARDQGHQAPGKVKGVPASVQLRPQRPIVADADRARLAGQVGVSEEQIEFAAHLMVELGILRSHAGKRGAPPLNEQRLGSVLTDGVAARRRTLASAWLTLPEVSDLRLVRDVLELRMDAVRLQWYASELPAEKSLRGLMARVIGHLATAPPRWYACSDLVGLCAVITPTRLHRGQHALSIWWFTPAGRPDIRLALDTPEGRRQVYGVILAALLRGPLRWLGMVEVVESGGELLFRPRPAAAILADREPDVAGEDAGDVSLLVEAEQDGTPIITVSMSGDDEMALFLGAVAEPLAPSPQGVRYRVTGAALQRIFETGLPATALVEWLEGSSKNGVPDTVRRRIERAWESFGTVRLYEDLTLLELGDDLLLRELEAMTGLRDATVHVFSPRLVAVDPDQVLAVLASLSKAGYRPRMLEGA